MSDRTGVDELVAPLPRGLQDQVLSYVAAVERSADAIFEEAGLKKTEPAMDTLRVLAAIRKIFGIASMGYWAIDNVLASGRDYSAGAIRIGGSIYSRDTQSYTDFKQFLSELSAGLSERNLLEHVRGGSYSEALREILRESD